jgi:ABC-type molybdenum transport system ATPase subunit/photorepair protein PhrA
VTGQPPVQAGVPAIEMIGVAVGAMRDPDALVAEGINWTVHSGDYWVVAGLHGAGKSDFLMLTGGLMPPRRGR